MIAIDIMHSNVSDAHSVYTRTHAPSSHEIDVSTLIFLHPLAKIPSSQHPFSSSHLSSCIFAFCPLFLHVSFSNSPSSNFCSRPLLPLLLLLPSVHRTGDPRRFIHAIVQGECALQRACLRTHEQTQRRTHLKQALDRRLRDGGIRSDSLVVPMVDDKVSEGGHPYVYAHPRLISIYTVISYHTHRQLISIHTSLHIYTQSIDKYLPSLYHILSTSRQLSHFIKRFFIIYQPLLHCRVWNIRSMQLTRLTRIQCKGLMGW